jgi:hypothetical protein
VAKRPKFSRWRRLPNVYRFGEKSRPEPKLEPQRLTLYLSWELLDAAEVQASQAGVATIQEYCTGLLEQALDNERIRAQVENIQAQRGLFEGLQEIADDPEYLAEWSAQSQAKAHPEPIPIEPPAGAGAESASKAEPAPREGEAPRPPRQDVADSSAPGRPSVRLSPSAEVIVRHAGPGGDDGASFLATLRRGETVPLAEVAELARALHLLEAELSDADVIDRRLVYALHRLALESQVLHTDAWPGAFDEWTVDTVRAVQEAVDRILSGQDIRYYPPGSGSQSPPEVPL